MEPKMKKLIEQGETILAEIGVLEGKVAEAEEGEAKTVAKAALDDKEKDWVALEAKIVEAKAFAAKELVLAEATRLAATVPGGDLSASAQAKDHDAEMEAKSVAFEKFVRGRSLSDGEMDLMTPQSKRFKEAAGGVVVPAALGYKMFGASWAEAVLSGIHVPGFEAKALPLTSGQATMAALIPQDYRRELLELPAEPPHIMGRATIVDSPTGTVTWPRLVQSDTNEYGGVVVNETAEGGTKPETEPQFEQLEISTIEVSAYTEVSATMLRRSALALEALISRLFRAALLDHFDRRFILGTGIGQIAGIVPTVGIRAVARAGAGAVSYADLVNLEHAVRAYHRAGATWVIGDDVVQSLKLVMDLMGRPLFVPDPSTGAYRTLLGYPYIATHRTPALGVSGDVIFGDLREYIVAVEQEIVVKRSEHFRFRNNVVAFVIYALVGGRLVQPRAMSILEGEES